MADERVIDELQLKLNSDIDETGANIDKVIASLEKLDTTVGKVVVNLAESKSILGEIKDGFGTLAKDFGKTKIKINVDTTDAMNNVRKLQRMLSASLAASSVDNGKLARDLASAYNITDVSEIRNIEKELDRVTNSVAKYGNSTATTEKAQRNIEDSLRKFSKRLPEVDSEVQKFYNDYKHALVNISDAEKDALGTKDYESIISGFPGMITRQLGKGFTVDDVWSELQHDYQGLFGNLDITNPAERIQKFFEIFREARNSVKPITGKDLIEADSSYGEGITNDVKNVIAQTVQTAQEEMKKVSAGKGFRYPVSFQIDNEAITQQLSGDLQRVVREAFAQLQNINISQEANNLTKLIQKYVSIGQADLSAVSGKLNTLSSGIQTFANGLKGVTVPPGVQELSGVIRTFSGVQKLDAGTILANAQAISTAIRRISEPLREGANFNPQAVTSLTSVIKVFQKIARIDDTKASQNIDRLASSIVSAVEKLNSSPAVRDDVMRFLDTLTKIQSKTREINAGLRTTGSSALPAFGNGLKKANISGKNLLYTFYKLRGVIWALRRAFNLFSSGIEYASDVVEVENVVRNTFRDAEGQVAEFANGTHQMLKDLWTEQGWDANNIPNLANRIGMNELTVKQMASRFQAMGKAMGFPNEEIATMSLRLTELAGDMASFYNIDDVSDVADDLAATFTGMTRPLRQYGLDLTIASLKEYAMSKGLDSNIQAMTQAEKTALRYQYILEHLQMVNGDFAATADTWANQVRILKMNVQELGGVWGGVFINAFKPFIRGLNSVLTSVIDFSKKIADALGAIFGWTIEITSGGMLDPLADLDGYAEDADGLSDGIGGAADNAKKLGKALTVLSFDELNQMNGESSSGGSGSGGSGSGVADAADAASGLDVTLKRVDTLMEKYKSNINNLFDLGRFISDSLSNAMDNIDWPSIYGKAAGFGTGLADFLNGLITPDLFGGLGRTIGGAINTALFSANAFVLNFDWRNLGASIAEGINRFFRTTNFKLAGATFNNFLNGILDAAVTEVENIEWDEIGFAIADFLGGIKIEDLTLKFLDFAGKLVAGIVQAIGTALLEISRKGQLDNVFLAAFALLKLPGLAGMFSNTIGQALTAGGFATALSATLKTQLLAAFGVAFLALYEFAADKVADIIKMGNDAMKDMTTGEILNPENEGTLRDSWDVKHVETGVGGLPVIEDWIEKRKHEVLNSFKGTPLGDLLGVGGSTTMKGSSGKTHGGSSRSFGNSAVETWKSIVEQVRAYNKVADDSIDIVAGLGQETYKTGDTTKKAISQSESSYISFFAKVKETSENTVSSYKTANTEIINNATKTAEEYVNAFDLDDKLNLRATSGAASFNNGIIKNAPIFIDSASMITTGILSKFDSAIPSIREKGSDFITSGLQPGWQSGKESFFANVVSKLGGEVKNSIGDISGTVSPKGQEAITGIMSGWNVKLPSLKELAGGLKATLKKSIGDTSDIMKPIGSDVVAKITDGLTSGIADVKTKLSNFGQAILNGIPGGTEMYNNGRSIFQRFADGVSSVYVPTPHFTQSTSIWDTIKDKLGNVVASLPKINVSWWASGGYFNGPNVIGVGEAGPEAVLPLSNRRAMSAIADRINQNGMGLSGSELTRAIAEGYARAMMLNPQPPINVNAVLYTEDDEVLARAVNRGNRSLNYRNNPTEAY